MDGRLSLAAQEMGTCPYTFNLIPSEYGMEIRKGFREHAISIETTTAYGVSTMIPFESVDGTTNKLFCATAEGIWDVTTYDTPVSEVAFTAYNTSKTGFGHFVHYVDSAGAQFIFYCDNLNGLWKYTASTDTWAQPTDITGVAEADLVGVVVHKLRIWFIERDSTNAWYLGAGSTSGTATKFTFGTKFKHGGKLTGLYNWSVDGGDGVDDYLVAVSTSGDVLPYRGEDPSAAATWQLKGSYYIGSMPEGFRSGVEFAGELYLISAFGMVSITSLMRGGDPENPERGSLAHAISKILQTSMATLRTEHGWNMQFIPSEGILLVVSPVQADGTYLQYVLNLVTKGWGFWRGVPILSAGTWNNTVYFGTADNRVMIMDVYRDDQLITGVGVNGSAIEYSILHSYSDFEEPAVNKIPQFVRPNFRALQTPVFDTKILYDYDLIEFSPVLGNTSNNEALWDVATWDVAVWGATEKAAYSTAEGSAGIGRALAVAIRGKAEAELLLISTDVMWKVGGFL
tara:strand:+ start:684 stop:2222 length:1539 start_codon:yes stop_codon:yes gene_type:complete